MVLPCPIVRIQKSPPGMLPTGFSGRKSVLALDRRQVDGCVFAAAIDLDLELEPVAFVDRRQAGTLDRRDVHERIRLSVIAADEAEALHGVEELDGALRLLAGQLALRATAIAAEATGRALARRRGTAAHDFHRL